jgi:response regulator NasT
VDDHERSRSALRSAIWAAGGEIVGESLRCRDTLAMIRRTSPDIVVCAAGLPDGDGVQAAAQVTDADCPVVRFTSHTDEALVERARAAGIMGFLLKPLRAAELAPALDLAIALSFAKTSSHSVDNGQCSRDRRGNARKLQIAGRGTSRLGHIRTHYRKRRSSR